MGPAQLLPPLGGRSEGAVSLQSLTTKNSSGAQKCERTYSSSRGAAMRKLFVMPRFLALHPRSLAMAACLVLLGAVVLAWLASRQTAAAQDGGQPSPEHMKGPKNYSPY